MQTQNFLAIAALVLFAASCRNPVAPPPGDDARPAVFPRAAHLQAGQSNRCRGEIISEVASDWPWPATREDFPPPPGAVKLWLEEIGPFLGVASVRELQEQFCAGGP